ncbi:MAG: 6-carboxytetrahydropterin synthase QueD [Coprococcus sp.]
MYKLKTKSDFDSAHFLSDYNGKCKNIHGHRWTVEVEAGGEELATDSQNRGMVVDFSDLKKDLNDITQEFDHSLIIEKGTLKEKTMEALNEEGFRIIELPFRPTAENFSRYFFERMKKRDYKIIAVSVYETPNNVASYTED